jgi:hypothetical protein
VAGFGEEPSSIRADVAGAKNTDVHGVTFECKENVGRDTFVNFAAASGFLLRRFS